MKAILTFLPAAVFTAGLAFADPVITPDSSVIAIDLDSNAVSNSDYPSNDSAASGIDGRTDTKYANTGGAWSGIIATPAAGAGAVKSFVITTAADFPERDPASWEIYGSNDPVTSGDNSRGEGESWTLIADGALSLPEDRLAAGTPVEVNNNTAWSSYRIIFPTLRDGAATVMQYAEIQFFTAEGGAGPPVLTPDTPVLAVQPLPVNSSSPPEATPPETVFSAIDGDAGTKYLNFGKSGTGFIVTPAAGSPAVRGLVVSTANDRVGRDPASFALYGTDDEISSGDHSRGDAENWTLITEGPLNLPAERSLPGEITGFANDTVWKSYRLIFPALKDGNEDSMQIAEVQFFSTEDAFEGGEILTPDDPILAIHFPATRSGYRTNNERPQNLVDGNIQTKYLNYSGRNSGFIITPASGPATVRSFVMTAANDIPDRDPVTWALYGTNGDIASRDNSSGTAENWTFIAAGAVELPDDPRFEDAPAVSFTNATSWKSYRMVMTSLKNPAPATLMQLAEIKFYTEANAGGTQILSPADQVLAIHVPSTNSGYPAIESPFNLLDDSFDTKYLNSGASGSGFIVTPALEARAVQSFIITTANDFEVRDPASWALYGTNDDIISPDNSEGNLENWTLVAGPEPLDLPVDRDSRAPAVNFENTTAWKSYRMVFPALRDAGAAEMQLADIQFYTAPDGGGEAVLSTSDDIRAVKVITSQSAFPAVEAPEFAIDSEITTKYLNTGGVNSGLIITPAGGSSVVTGFTVTTANDIEGRDPAAYALYGTSDPITSMNNSLGNEENWTLISSGSLDLPEGREETAPAVAFANTTAWTSYRFVVTALRDNNSPLMQFAELQFEGVFAQQPPGGPALLITGVTAQGNPVQSVTLTWDSAAGASYTIQTSTDPAASWTQAGTFNATGAVSTTTLDVPAAGPRRFFRILKN